MKTQIELFYFNANDEYEFHLRDTSSEYYLACYSRNNTAPEFKIQSDDDYKPSIPIPDFTRMTEEEVFQSSLVWDAPYTVYFLFAAQKFILENLHMYKGCSHTNLTLEY